MYEHNVHKLPHTLSGIAYGVSQYRLMKKKGLINFSGCFKRSESFVGFSN